MVDANSSPFGFNSVVVNTAIGLIVREVVLGVSLVERQI